LPPKSSLPPRASSKTTTVKCLQCGKEMLRYQSTVRMGRGRHCSRACADSARTLRRKAEPIPATRNCKMCGQVFIPTTHHHLYCSEKCNHKYHDEVVPNCYPGASTMVKGEVSEHLVIIDLLLRGWHVFKPVSFGCGFDYIAMRAGTMYKIEVKLGHKRRRNGKLEVVLAKTENPQYDVIATVWDNQIFYSDLKGATVCL